MAFIPQISMRVLFLYKDFIALFLLVGFNITLNDLLILQLQSYTPVLLGVWITCIQRRTAKKLTSFHSLPVAGQAAFYSQGEPEAPRQNSFQHPHT